MNKERFIKLLSKKLSGEISDADSKALDHAISSSAEYKQLADKLEDYFYSSETMSSPLGKLNGTWEKIADAENSQLPENFNYSSFRTGYSSFLKVAAVVLLFLGISFLGYRLLYMGEDADYNIMSANQSKTFRLLDDGTKVWLNKRSSLRYNKTFGEQKREIYLEGEAYFDVVKNNAVPLIIHVGNIDIEVKGTAFNVKAYKDNPEIEVALLRGLIQVSHRINKNDQVLLKPNEKLIVGKHNFSVLPVTSAMLSQEAKWTSDSLVFHKEKLKDLALQMEKKYEFKIEIRSDRLKEKRFSGIFSNETIQQALEALKLSYPLNYTINDSLVVIRD